MNQILFVSAFLLVLFSLGFSHLSFGQDRQSAGGVNVEGSWYLGEGLKAGDYFEYNLCQLDLHDCAPITLKMWVKGLVQHGTEKLWDTEVVVIDGNKIVKGAIGLGETAPEPITFDEPLHDYAIAFKSSLSWLSAFATGNQNDLIHGPKEFKDAAWGKIGAIGGSQLIPLRTEKIYTPAGSVDTVVVGWYSGNNNEIWISDGFPFPVKALTYAWVTTGIAPVMYQFELQKYQEHVVNDPFANVESTVSKTDLLKCTTNFYEYTSGRQSTNTHTMMIQYNYSPKVPIEGCFIDWKINFMNKYNDVEFVDQVHYDIWVIDNNGNRLRSYAQDIGRADLFNGFGQAHVLLPIKEKAGLVHYIIFVHGTGPESDVPDASMGGYAAIDVQIAENPLLAGVNDNASKIPSWIKNNAGWWKEGKIDDNSFVQGIQYLIKQGIMKIPPTTQGAGSANNSIPSWIKNNAGWWAEGSIDDNSFVQGIQFLIQEGIMKIQLPSSAPPSGYQPETPFG
ncbi:MAG TPA: peptidase [Nitrosarchaeum sp.]|nr:peptidase [Nitrosarchaeum sp.]